jgi:dipeptidyl aminopeptidase/acylaminoacyl peptidase
MERMIVLTSGEEISYKLMVLPKKIPGLNPNSKKPSWRLMMRKQQVVMGLVVCWLISCGAQKLVSTPDKKVQNQIPVFDTQAFYETISLRGLAFSPDGQFVVYSSDASGVYNLYRQSVTGGLPQQLTHSAVDSYLLEDCFPNDQRCLFRADKGGNEIHHLFVLSLKGAIKELTPGEKVRAEFYGFSKDGLVFWVSTNERDPKFFDLYSYTTDDLKRRLVFKNTGGSQIAEVSNDGRWVALMKTNSNADNDIFLVDTRSPGSALELVTPHKGDVSYVVHSFDQDSSHLVYGTDAHGEFGQAWRLDLTTFQHELVFKANWDVVLFSYSKTGRYRVTAINEDARQEVQVVDTTTGKEIVFKGLPDGAISHPRFSPGEDKVAFYLHSDRSPSFLFAADLKTKEVKLLTDSLNPAIDRQYLVDSRVVRFKSFDGLEIPAILYKPHTATTTNKVPALVWVHGGPGGQSLRLYRADVQHLVNRGYAVLAVNNRGSSGYGKTFFHLDDRRHGDLDLKDCIWGRTYLESLEWVDGKRIGIIGGSYGGYMVAAALAFEPEAFDVGIDIFGVTNWVRTLESIPPWWEAFRKGLYAELGDPALDKERLQRISPLFHAKNIVKPLLVIQGRNDPRVLQVESDELVAAVRKNNVPVEYVIFEDEGHGFRKRKNRITASDACVGFLDHHLKAKDR